MVQIAMLISMASAYQPAAQSSRSTVGQSSLRCRSVSSPFMKWGVDIAPWNVEYGQQSAPVQLPAGVVKGGPPAPFKITDEQRRKLLEDGAVHIPGLLTPEWLEYLRGATDWQVNTPWSPHAWLPFSSLTLSVTLPNSCLGDPAGR